MNAHLECPRCGERAMTIFQKARRRANRAYRCAHCGGAVAMHASAYFWAAFPALILMSYAFKPALARIALVAILGFALIVFYLFSARIVLHHDPITFDS